MTVHVTIEVSDADRITLESLAEVGGESIGALLTRAASALLEEHEVYVAEIEIGREAFRRGDVLTHEEVKAEALARRVHR